MCQQKIEYTAAITNLKYTLIASLDAATTPINLPSHFFLDLSQT